MISSADPVPATTGSLLRDPVLVLPLAVVIGLAVGWEGLRTGVSGAVIAVDLALSWGLVSASVLAVGMSWSGIRFRISGQYDSEDVGATPLL